MTKGQRDQLDLLQETLDMLVLRTLLFGPLHGHSIAHTIRRTSGDVLRVDHGSLYRHCSAESRAGPEGWGTRRTPPRTLIR